MKRKFLGLVAASTLLGACAYHPVPYETIRPEQHQLNMEAANHWNRLAAQVASNIKNNLPINHANDFMPTPLTTAPAAFDPVPVASGYDPLADMPPGTLPPPGAAPSGDPFMDLPHGNDPTVIQLDLSDPNLGLPPGDFTASSMGAMQIASSTPTSLGSNTRPVLYINPPKGGFETPFAYSFHSLLRSHLVQQGVAVTTNPDSVNTYCTDAMFCRPMLLDYHVDLLEHKDRWHVYEPRTEVIINTAVSDGDLVVFSRSDMYYINPGDQDHYVRGTRSLKVVDK